MSLTSKKYELTGVKAVDMVAAAVEYHYNHYKGLKTIYLTRRLYDQFKAYAERKSGRTAEVLTFENVEVKPASVLSFKDIYFDFYPQKINNVN